MRVQRLAEQLDVRLTGISSAVGDIGDDRLLLIAALALLDELDAARQTIPSSAPSSAADARAATLITAMAAKVEALAARLESGGAP